METTPTPPPDTPNTPGTGSGTGSGPERPGPLSALRNDEGAATAEYAVVIMAAVGFAGLLVVILRSPEVRAMLVGLVERALNAAG